LRPRPTYIHQPKIGLIAYEGGGGEVGRNRGKAQHIIFDSFEVRLELFFFEFLYDYRIE
jgi:hypothetical protein